MTQLQIVAEPGIPQIIVSREFTATPAPIQTGGIPEAREQDTPKEVPDSIAAGIAKQTMLGRPASLDDLGNVAAFAASDWARTLTATKLNVTGGAVPE